MKKSNGWIVAALAALIGAQGCTTPIEGPEEETASEQSSFLFGLSAEEVSSIHPLVAHRYSMEEWMEASTGPFSCDRYGDLCEEVGPEAAYELVEGEYLQALEGASIDEIDSYLSDEIDIAAVTWAALHADSDELASDTSYAYGGSNQERVRIKVYAVKPAIGTWHGKTECTYQVKTFGIWGGTLSATHKAKVKGHMHNLNGNAVGQNPSSGGYYYRNSYAHKVTSPKAYFYPSASGWEMDITGVCESSKGNWSATGSERIIH